MQQCLNVNRKLRGHYDTDLWWMVFFRSQDDVTKLVCHIYDIMLRLVDKPGLFVLRNCLTESMSGIHSVISSRCLYLITPLLYMFFLLHMFGCFGSCGTYPTFWRSVFCCLSCLVSNFTPMVGRLTCLRYFILWSSIHVSAFVRQGKPLDLFGGCFIDCFCILC